MKRRHFLLTGLAVSATGGFPPKTAWASKVTQQAWREFELTIQVDIHDAEGAVKAWVPVPLLRDTSYFRRQTDRIVGNFTTAKTVSYDAFGTGLVLAEWAPGVANPALEIKSRFATCDRRADFNGRAPAVKEARAVLDHFRQPTRLLPTDGIVAETARQIVGERRNDLHKARAIYRWIVENTFRDPKVRGCGLGNIRAMLETRNLGGKCADLNALFVGLARAAGLAARDVYGVRIAPSATFKSLGRAGDVTGAQHCRAEVYLTGLGWMPVDPADVRKVVLEEGGDGQPLGLDDARVVQAREQLFGRWEMNWVPFNYAHDVRLPGATGPELAYLMYPQAETKAGRKDCLDAKTFSYRLSATEV